MTSEVGHCVDYRVISARSSMGAIEDRPAKGVRVVERVDCHGRACWLALADQDLLRVDAGLHGEAPKPLEGARPGGSDTSDWHVQRGTDFSVTRFSVDEQPQQLLLSAWQPLEELSDERLPF